MADFLLLETGDRLLLETGDKVVLETPNYVGGSATTGDNIATKTLTFPTVQAGDLAIIQYGQTTTDTLSADATDSGFTLIDTTDDGTNRRLVYTKTCDGSEDGTTITFTTSPIGRHSGQLVVYRGCTFGSIDSAVETGTDLTHESPPVTTTVADQPTVIMVMERISSGTASYTVPTGWTKRQEHAVVGSGGFTGAVADDLAATRASSTLVTPGSWVGSGTNAANVVTTTILLVPDTAGGTDATVTGLSVVAGVASVPAPALSSLEEAVTVIAVASVPAPALASTEVAVTVAAVAAVPAPALSSTEEAVTVAAVVAIPTPEIPVAASVTTVSAVTTVGTVGISAGLTATAVSATAAVPTIGISAGLTAGVVPVVAAVGTAGISAGLTVTAVSAVADVPAPSLPTGPMAAVVAAIAAAPAPTLHTGSTVTTVAVAGVAALAAPTVSVPVSQTVTPSLVAARAAVGTPPVIGDGSAAAGEPVPHRGQVHGRFPSFEFRRRY